MGRIPHHTNKRSISAKPAADAWPLAILVAVSQLSEEQIARHAYEAGFRGDDLATAVAVAMAESSGNTRSHNGTGLDDSYGLWQVNMHGDLGPARREQFDLDSDKDLYDPGKNAEAAFDIYRGRGKSFEDWSTFNDGSYEKHMDEARKAARDVAKNPGRDPGEDRGSGGGGGKPGDGFAVDTEHLRAYQQKVDAVADSLDGIGKRTVHAVRGIAKDSFGEVGRETGFSDALGDFSASLEKQVRATGAGARKLGAATADAARTYQEADDNAARELKSVLGWSGRRTDGGCRGNRTAVRR